MTQPIQPIAPGRPRVGAVEPTLLTPVERERQRRRREQERRKRRAAAASPESGRPRLDVRG